MLENNHSSDDFLSNEIRNELPAEKRVPAAQLKRAELALMARLDALQDGQNTSSIKRGSRSGRRWMIAAAVALLAAGGIWLLSSRTVRQDISTPYGQMGSQVLADGTSVLLNANSQLVAEGDWKKAGTRKIHIKGEAFLQVSAMAHSPFIVNTDHLTIEVLGTGFNVVNRNGLESVFLKEGRIRVALCDGKSIVMKPGDFVSLEGGKPVLMPVSVDSLTAWQQQKLIFDKTPLKAVKRILEDQYGIHVQLATPAIEDSMITAIVPNDNLDVLLRALRATSDYDVVRDKDSIKITARAERK